MASPPIDPSTAHAVPENIHCRKDMVGNVVSCIVPVQCFKQTIADRTASQNVIPRSGKERKHLPDLFFNMAICYQEMVRCKRAAGKGGVAGQDNPALLQSDAQDFVIREGSIIEHIETKQPQTSSQAAKHGIGDEFHMTSYLRQRSRGMFTMEVLSESVVSAAKVR